MRNLIYIYIISNNFEEFKANAQKHLKTTLNRHQERCQGPEAAADTRTKMKTALEHRKQSQEQLYNTVRKVHSCTSNGLNFHQTCSVLNSDYRHDNDSCIPIGVWAVKNVTCNTIYELRLGMVYIDLADVYFFN